MVVTRLVVAVALVASVVVGDPGGAHGGSDGVRGGVEHGRVAPEVAGRQHKSLSSNAPSFDQVVTKDNLKQE